MFYLSPEKGEVYVRLGIVMTREGLIMAYNKERRP